MPVPTFAKTTPEQDALIQQIVERALPDATTGQIDLAQVEKGRLSLTMDIRAAMTQVDLDLGQLLHFDDFNFAHDVIGLMNSMDRTTGKLDERFLPRCARKLPGVSS